MVAGHKRHSSYPNDDLTPNLDTLMWCLGNKRGVPDMCHLHGTRELGILLQSAGQAILRIWVLPRYQPALARWHLLCVCAFGRFILSLPVAHACLTIACLCDTILTR